MRQKKQDSKPYLSNVGKDYVARATLMNGRVPPRKARLIIDLIKDMQVDSAIQVLQHSPRKGAKIVLKLLKSAISNAKENADCDVDQLWVTGGWADMGRTLKRFMPRAQGRATPKKKKASHITICLGQE